MDPTTSSGSGAGGSRTGASDRTGMPGVESASGRDRTKDGDLPPDMATNRRAPGAESGSNGGGGLIDQAPVAVRQAADQARDTMGQVMETAQQQVTQRLSGQIDRATEGLGTVSQAVSAVSRQLREQNQEPLAMVTDRAAEQVDRVAGYLRGKDLDEIVEDTERFARLQPAVFLGTAFGLGLLASRFLKSSRPRQYGYQPALPAPRGYGYGQAAGPYGYGGNYGQQGDYGYAAGTPRPGVAAGTTAGMTGGTSTLGRTGTTGATRTLGSTGMTGTTGTAGPTGTMTGTGQSGTTGTTGYQGDI